MRKPIKRLNYLCFLSLFFCQVMLFLCCPFLLIVFYCFYILNKGNCSIKNSCFRVQSESWCRFSGQDWERILYSTCWLCEKKIDYVMLTMWWINSTRRDILDGLNSFHLSAFLLGLYLGGVRCQCSSVLGLKPSAPSLFCVTRWLRNRLVSRSVKTTSRPSRAIAVGCLNCSQSWTFVSAGRLRNGKVKTKPDTFESRPLCSILIPTHTHAHTHTSHHYYL